MSVFAQPKTWKGICAHYGDIPHTWNCACIFKYMTQINPTLWPYFRHYWTTFYHYFTNCKSLLSQNWTQFTTFLISTTYDQFLPLWSIFDSLKDHTGPLWMKCTLHYDPIVDLFLEFIITFPNYHFNTKLEHHFLFFLVFAQPYKWKVSCEQYGHKPPFF